MAEDITDEFAGVDLKDKRRNLRLHKFVAAKAKSPSASIAAACGGWSDTIAAYRLLGCAEVIPAALLAPLRRCSPLIRRPWRYAAQHMGCPRPGSP